MNKRLFAVFAAVLTLAGCAVGPSYSPDFQRNESHNPLESIGKGFGGDEGGGEPVIN